MEARVDVYPREERVLLEWMTNPPPLIFYYSPPQSNLSLACYHLVMKPIASYIAPVFRPAIIGMLSITAAAPGILYSLTYLSGTQPHDISMAWWDTMSVKIKILSVISAIATLFYNLLTNMKYIPESWESLKNNFRQCCHSPSSFIKNSILILLALSAADAAGFNAYNSFTWTFFGIGTSVGIANFFVYAARRYEGATKMFERIYNVFSADARLQAAIVDRTRYIKSEFRKIVEAEFKDKEINSATAMEFLTFINLLNQKQLERYNQTIFLKKPCCHYFSNFLNGCFWLLLSLLSASLVFPINVQNGFEGVNVLFGLFKHSLATLTHFYKIMIGILPGLTNSFFYLISTLNCHYTLLNLQDSLSRDHSVSAIIKLLSVLIIAVSAAIGYITISKSVTENSNNIFAIQVKSIWSEIINYGNGIAMFLVSLNNLENAIVSTKPFKKSYNDYMRFLDRKNLTKENISVLRQYSYFKKPSFEHKYSDNLNKNQLSLSYH